VRQWDVVYEGGGVGVSVKEQLIPPGQVMPARARTNALCKKMVSCGSSDSTSTPGFSVSHHPKNSSILLESLEKLSGGSHVHWSSSYL